MKKVSILTPTYNDSESILKTLESVFHQTYQNWEHIIIDDGSTDHTKEIIEKYRKEKQLEDKITYIYQENKDQLNAIIHGMDYITGDYVYTLHSDDLLPSDDFLEKGVSFLEDNPKCDAMIGDLIIIDENDHVTNCWKALNYVKKTYIPVLVMLNYGANIYGDVSLQKKENLLWNVYPNYLTWNTPFWIKMDECEMTSMKKAPFPILKYRIHSTNYVSSEIGKFNALNGELRTLTRLMNYYHVPFFSLQRMLLKFLRMKGIRKLKLTPYFHPIYFKRSQKNKAKIIERAILQTYQSGYQDNLFLTSLISFYQKNSSRKIKLENLKKETIYQGKDIRTFTKKLLDGTLPLFYKHLFEEMEKGFGVVLVKKEEEKYAIDVLKFLCLYPYVEVRVEEKNGNTKKNSLCLDGRKRKTKEN